jgi:hypothetical protein
MWQLQIAYLRKIVINQLEFEVLTTVSTNMAVFWVVAPRSLMMEASRSSETLVNFYQTTRRYIPEDSHLPNKLMFSRRSLFEFQSETSYSDSRLLCYYHFLCGDVRRVFYNRILSQPLTPWWSINHGHFIIPQMDAKHLCQSIYRSQILIWTTAVLYMPLMITVRSYFSARCW